MKKIFTILILFTISVFAFGQFGKTGGGKITVKEADGSPSGSNIDTVKVNNGSLTISGSVATLNITAAAAGSADSIRTGLGTIDADTVVLKTRTQTITGDKTFTGSVTLPLNCITADQIATNAVGSFEIAGGAVTTSELKDYDVQSADIDTGVVNLFHLAADAVDSNKVVNGSLTNADLKSSTIQSSRLATGAVTRTKLGANAVGEEAVSWSNMTKDSVWSALPLSKRDSTWVDGVFTGSLDAPSGANPTTDAAGEIAVDTDDHFIEFYSDASRVLGALQIRTFTILEPDIARGITDDIILFHVMADAYPHGITIKDIALSGSASFTDTHVIEEWSNRAGDTQTTIESIAVSAAVYQEDDGTLSDASIAADAFVNINLDDSTDNIASLEITITFWINPGD